MSGHQQVNGNINSFNTINFFTDTDIEGRQILQWLSPLEPQQRHQGVRIERLDGVGNWLLETNEFRRWSDTKDGCVEPVLFCSGNPGVGKTYLSSLVIDSLCDQAKGKDIAVMGLYCDFLAQEEQSAANMLGAILKQLGGRGEIPEHIREVFRNAKKEFGGRGLRLPDMVEILKKALAALVLGFICIDGLDESAPKQRRELLESLREIVRVSPNTRIFLTGRPHIQNEIVNCFSGAVRIPISPTQADIKSYLKMKLDADTEPSAMDDKLRADIMRVIPEKISEIFLLVSLNIDAILGEITLYQRRKKLDDMTKGKDLGDAYAATLSRMKAQQRARSKLGIQVLMWVSHSERPLHVDELCHALGVEEGSGDLNIQNIPTVETVLACSLGLVTIEKFSSTFRPVHYTLQEYLSHNPNLFLQPHSIIAEVCLTYLNFQHVMGLSTALCSAPPTAPFAQYASCYWGTHARRETTKSVKSLALKLLDGYDKHISSKLLLLHEMRFLDAPLDREGKPRGFTGLHGAAYLGCAEITIALLERNKWDLQATDFNGNTAIAWAARMGHEVVVRVLLERDGIDPDIADTWNGRTPLLWAAKNGHEGVVKMLLERNDVNPDTVDTKYGRTPLSWAVVNGHEGVVRMLLERSDANYDTADTWNGRSPLSWAAENGHEGLVRMLLEWSEVNPNAADSWDDRTPLLWAAENGHEGVARVLLERNDVNPNTADAWDGRTPLLWALENGHEGVARMLLQRDDVNPDTADSRDGRTPLSWAAENGHEGLAKILLERSGINPDIADSWGGRTPLLWAAENGHERVARMLLQRDDVNPDTADSWDGRTPLSWAVENGHEGVVKALLEGSDANPNIADTRYGRTPLLSAVINGHERAVRMLLERNDVNPNTANTEYGQTPLLWAAGNGHESVVRMLLARNDVNPNTTDAEYGQTPLSWAAENGYEGVVRMLLQRSDVNPEIADAKYGRTPLSWAAENRHEGVVRILLERKDINPNTTDTRYGRTPLFWAIMDGHEGVVRTLLERNDVNPNKADTEHGQTPLSWAAENGYEGVVRILLKRSDVDPNKVDAEYGQTPLLWAAENGHESVVRMLLERSDVNPNKVDAQNGQTPLSWAAENGYEEVVRMLLERSDVNPNTADTEYGQTPLEWAAENGHERIVEMLQGRVDFVLRYPASLRSIEPFSPEPPNLSEPPSKRARRF